MKNTLNLSPTAAKYKNMRFALLIILIFSAINLFSVLGGIYFLFSAYIPQLFSTVGVFLYTESGMMIYFVVATVLGLICLIPYLLAYIFSKKQVGWMIAALVLFAIDSTLFAVDFFLCIFAGDFSYILDLAFHVYALVCLILGVKYGKELKLEEAAAAQAAAVAVATAPESEQAPVEESAYAGFTRQLLVQRKKSFVCCAVSFIICVNGEPVATLKNGQSVSLTVPATSFLLGATVQNGLMATEVQIPEGDGALDYTVSVKMGFTTNDLIIAPTIPTVR